VVKWGINAEKQTIKPLEIAHAGVSGSMKNVGKVFCHFIDDFSRNVWVHMIKPKGQWFEMFKGFQIFV